MKDKKTESEKELNELFTEGELSDDDAAAAAGGMVKFVRDNDSSTVLGRGNVTFGKKPGQVAAGGRVSADTKLPKSGVVGKM